MIPAWYCFVSFLLVMYVVLDGRNFGAGMLHWLVAKTPAERRQVVAAIGPMWTWHEVWLIAFGGTLLAIFPKLMAASFAGYYLALFLILWCILLRGLALELGGHINDAMWQSFWDFVFVFSSTLLAVLFGAAGGNVARGVPLDADGSFSMAFFTNFGVAGNNLGLLDWYTVSVAVFATVTLAAHGANYLVLKTDGPVHDRSVAFAKGLWLAAVPLFVMVSLESWYVRPDLPGQMVANPLVWVGVICILASAGALVTGLKRRIEMRAFLGGNFVIVGMLATGAAGIFPVMLHSTLAPENSMTAYNVASSPAALAYACVWWPVALTLTISYFVYMSRYYYGKVSIPRELH